MVAREVLKVTVGNVEIKVPVDDAESLQAARRYLDSLIQQKCKAQEALERRFPIDGF